MEASEAVQFQKSFALLESTPLNDFQKLAAQGDKAGFYGALKPKHQPA